MVRGLQGCLAEGDLELRMGEKGGRRRGQQGEDCRLTGAGWRVGTGFGHSLILSSPATLEASFPFSTLSPIPDFPSSIISFQKH